MNRKNASLGIFFLIFLAASISFYITWYIEADKVIKVKGEILRAWYETEEVIDYVCDEEGGCYPYKRTDYDYYFTVLNMSNNASITLDVNYFEYRDFDVGDFIIEYLSGRIELYK